MFLLSFFTINLWAQIFNGDDRISFHQLSENDQKTARSVVALIPKKHLNIEGKTVQSTQPKFGEKFRMCPDEKFFQEDFLANCSGALIDQDKVLTAAHCLSDDKKDSSYCENYYFVFDYYNNVESIKIQNIYECKKVEHYDAAQAFEIDLAVIKLTKKVSHRTPIKLSTEDAAENELISMMGFPLGISLKQTQGEVVNQLSKKPFFKHNLDTFSVNSGSPTFNAWGEIIGVLVRSTGYNRSKDEANDCYRWSVATTVDSAESTKISKLPLKYFK